MLCKDLKVVALSITEDFYKYKGVFQLCGFDKSIEVDLDYFENDKLNEIKNIFQLPESPDEIKNIIMEKVMQAANDESRIVEGKDIDK